MSSKKPLTVVALGTSKRISLDCLVPSNANVRRHYSHASVKRLAASILARGVIQDLLVRPETGEDGKKTGAFEVMAGGRRLAALRLLAKQGKIAANAPVPCRERKDAVARDLSLAENFEREAMHPADEFEAFRDLHQIDGQSIEAIAARYGVKAPYVRQRLKLGVVSPKLIAAYRDDELTLDQLMAFTVSDDHAAQEAVWNRKTWHLSPQTIRNALLQSHLPATDRRVRFVGLDAYKASGGTVLRDLFTEDDGGYVADRPLLDRLATEKLATAAAALAAEGWQWIETTLEPPYDHDLRRLRPEEVPLSHKDQKRYDRLAHQIDRLSQKLNADENEDLQAQYDAKVGELEALDAKRRVYSEEQKAQSGVLVGIDPDGGIEFVRGLLKPDAEGGEDENSDEHGEDADRVRLPRPVHSMKLTAELTAQHTAALRNELAAHPDIALRALVHAMALRMFYDDAGESCLTVSWQGVHLPHHAPTIVEGIAWRAMAERHEGWLTQLPQDAASLWAFVLALPSGDLMRLAAHCIAETVDGVVQKGGPAHHHAANLAEAVSLDLRKYWTPTAANYFDHIPKHAVLAAIGEAQGTAGARRAEKLKKADMAMAAEHTVTKTGWLPALFRLSEQALPLAQAAE